MRNLLLTVYKDDNPVPALHEFPGQSLEVAGNGTVPPTRRDEVAVRFHELTFC